MPSQSETFNPCEIQACKLYVKERKVNPSDKVNIKNSKKQDHFEVKKLLDNVVKATT